MQETNKRNQKRFHLQQLSNVRQTHHVPSNHQVGHLQTDKLRNKNANEWRRTVEAVLFDWHIKHFTQIGYINRKFLLENNGLR